MPAPTPYARSYGFAAYQSQYPSTPLPGDQVDAELDAAAAALRQAIAALGAIQRSDGALANRIVTQDTLAPNVVALFTAVGVTPRGTWTTSTAYAAKDSVVQTGSVYLCMVPHTSGTFATDLAAGKWALLSNVGANQALNTTDSPTFAGLTLSGNASVAGTATLGKVLADANFGRTATNTKTARAPATSYNIFTVPVSLSNRTSHIKVKISAVNSDISAGYASEYAEWVISYGSYAGAYLTPTWTRVAQVKRSVNASVNDITTTVTAVIASGVLTISAEAASGGSTGFTTFDFMVQAEHIGESYATPITKV